jgi:hypothetical protein
MRVVEFMNKLGTDGGNILKHAAVGHETNITLVSLGLSNYSNLDFVTPPLSERMTLDSNLVVLDVTTNRYRHQICDGTFYS